MKPTPLGNAPALDNVGRGPPDDVTENDSADPITNVAESVEVIAGAWMNGAKVTSAAIDWANQYVSSSALLTFTLHTPGPDKLSVYGGASLSTQEGSLGKPVHRCQLTSPVPAPPLKVRSNGVPAVPLVEVTVSGGWSVVGRYTRKVRRTDTAGA